MVDPIDRYFTLREIDEWKSKHSSDNDSIEFADHMKFLIEDVPSMEPEFSSMISLVQDITTVIGLEDIIQERALLYQAIKKLVDNWEGDCKRE